MRSCKSLFCLLLLCSFFALLHADEKTPKAATPLPQHFKVEELAAGFVDPQEMVMLPDGRILICERQGKLRVFSPKTGKLSEGGEILVTSKYKEYARECGFIGLTIDPQFSKNNWIYCYYSTPSKHLENMLTNTMPTNLPLNKKKFSRLTASLVLNLKMTKSTSALKK